MTINGLYKVKDKYFTDFKSPHWIDNKSEGRPYYYAIEDTSGIYWLIPLSKQVANYNIKIAREESRRGVGNCLYYHIGKISGQERVFIISDMFPVTDEYVCGEYTMGGVHYVVKDKALVFALRSKAMKYLKLIESKKLRCRIDIIGIKKKLLGL